MNELHAELFNKGLVVVGVTDENRDTFQPYVETNGITYAIAQAKAAHFYQGGIPHAFLIDAKGKVVWEGHPGGLQKSTIADAMKGARRAGGLGGPLASVDKLMDAEQFGKAHAEAKKLLAGTSLQDEARATAEALCAELEKSCIDAVEAGLAAFAAQNWYEASLRLNEGKKYSGLPRSEEATARLAELAGNAAARKEIDAGTQLAKAIALESDKEFDKAHKAYAAVTSGYSGSKAAADATARREALEKDGKLGFLKTCDTCKTLGYACPAHKKKKK